MSRVWPVNILFHTWDRSLFIVVDSRLKISLEKKSRQIQAETSDFILNPAKAFVSLVTTWEPKCWWLSDRMQPVERTLLIFDYY